MKKLMTVVSVAATLLAFGAVNGDEVRTFTNTGFEDDPPYKAGELLSTTNDDAGKVKGESGFAATWVALPEEEVVEHEIRAYGENDPAPEGGGSQYLHVESSNTSTLLQRNVQPGGAVASIGDGIYLDTLVKFSPADKLFEASDITTGDKIAITYVGEDPTEVANPISNIVVCAGYVDGSTIVPTNYVMNLPDNADFDVNAWHRLTVRSIANVGSSVAPVGFAIYIDGNPKPLTYASDVAAGDLAYVGSLNAAVQTYLYNGEKHALLPSLVANGGTDFDKLTTVGFKGSGCVDNLAFTADPGFIEEGTAVEIAWDEGVATYKVVDSANNILVDDAVTGGEAGSTNLLLEVGITYLTVTATYGTGYEAGKWTSDPEEALVGDQFTVSDGATLTIASMTPKFDVGGVHYGSFDDALDAAVEAGTAAEPATIQLLADADSALTFDEGYIILDLNGKTIQGGDLDTYSVVNSGATLTIIDSATGGTVVAPTFADAEGAFYTDDGSTTINAGRFESTVFTEKLLDPEASGDIVVNGGVFYDPDYDPEDVDSKFYLYDYLADGVKATYDAGYFTVGEPIIGTYTVTVTPNANATYSAAYNDGGAAVEFVNDVAAVTVGKTITITASPKSGYEYAEQPTGWTLSEGVITKEISAAAEVEIPAPTAVVIGTYTVTVTPTANATYAAIYNEGGAAVEFVNDVAAVTVGKTITITATPASGYEYADTPTGWTAGQDGKITIEVSAEATVAIPAPTAESSYPSYIPEDAAVKAKYDTWATTYGADTGSVYEDAFLLNIAPDAVDQTLEPTSITISGGKIVIDANKDLDAVNGKVYIKTSATLSGLATALWSEATVNASGEIEMTPNGTAAFFKIKVDFAAGNP